MLKTAPLGWLNRRKPVGCARSQNLPFQMSVPEIRRWSPDEPVPAITVLLHAA